MPGRVGDREAGDTADFMADLHQWLLDGLTLALGGLAALVLRLLIGFFVQSARLVQAVRDYRELVAGPMARPSTTGSSERRAGGEGLQSGWPRSRRCTR